MEGAINVPFHTTLFGCRFDVPIAKELSVIEQGPYQLSPQFVTAFPLRITSKILWSWIEVACPSPEDVEEPKFDAAKRVLYCERLELKSHGVFTVSARSVQVLGMATKRNSGPPTLKHYQRKMILDHLSKQRSRPC